MQIRDNLFLISLCIHVFNCLEIFLISFSSITLDPEYFVFRISVAQPEGGEGEGEWCVCVRAGEGGEDLGDIRPSMRLKFLENLILVFNYINNFHIFKSTNSLLILLKHFGNLCVVAPL